MANIGTALVTIPQPTGALPRRQAAPARASCAFMAQLLATRNDAPCSRKRRRIEPALGIAAYREAAQRATTPMSFSAASA